MKMMSKIIFILLFLFVIYLAYIMGDDSYENDKKENLKKSRTHTNYQSKNFEIPPTYNYISRNKKVRFNPKREQRYVDNEGNFYDGTAPLLSNERKWWKRIEEKLKESTKK